MVDIKFARPQGRSLLLDVYQLVGGPICLVFMFGDAWHTGHRATVLGNCGGLYLAPRGHAVAAVSYRLSKVARFPAQVRDVQSEIGFLLTNAEYIGLDLNRLAELGPSAASSLTWRTPSAPFFFAIHGDADTLVPFPQIQLLHVIMATPMRRAMSITMATFAFAC